MKNLTILKRKNISDNILSFLFLINKINYKKLKSITKRSLLPHYVFYKFLLKALKLSFNKSWHRNFVQINYHLNPVLPGSFIEKRMFFKNIKLLSNYNNSLNNSYSWYNRKDFFFLKKDIYFNKVNTYPLIGGQNILTTSVLKLPKEDLNNVFFKNVFLNLNINFNSFLFFNIALLGVVETYKVLTLLWFYTVTK